MKTPLINETEARTLIRSNNLIGAIKLIREGNGETVSSLMDAKLIVERWKEEMSADSPEELAQNRICRAQWSIRSALDNVRAYEGAELDKLPDGACDANDQIKNARAVIDKLLDTLDALELLS